MKYKLKALRVGKGYKQGDFAKLCGISREYLCTIENGKAKNPSIPLMKKIAELLGTTPQDLFFND